MIFLKFAQMMVCGVLFFAPVAYGKLSPQVQNIFSSQIADVTLNHPNAIYDIGQKAVVTATLAKLPGAGFRTVLESYLYADGKSNWVNFKQAGRQYSYTTPALVKSGDYSLQINFYFENAKEADDLRSSIVKIKKQIEAITKLIGQASTPVLEKELQNLNTLLKSSQDKLVKARALVFAKELKFSVKEISSAPTAKLSLSVTDGIVPLEVTLDASASTDPQGQSLTYEFDFGDGVHLDPQANPSVTHVYESIGLYSASVKVRNSSGLLSLDWSPPITVRQNPNPVANLVVTNGPGSMQVLADGSGSTDPQSLPIFYSFDFGDGIPTGFGNEPTMSHQYDTPGFYFVKLTVMNIMAFTSVAIVPVFVTEAPPPMPPVARATITPQGGSAPLLVSIDASGSSDPQGLSLSYSYDFGDGTQPYQGPLSMASHLYVNPGQYSVVLKVTNSNGLESTTTKVLNVVGNAVPVSSFIYSFSTSTLSVHFDGSASVDSDGSIASYQWSFGDGTTGTGAVVDHLYQAVGTYLVRLTVVDNLGLSNYSEIPVAVTDPTMPIITSLSPVEGTNVIGKQITISGTSNVPLGYICFGSQLATMNGSSFSATVTVPEYGLQQIYVQFYANGHSVTRTLNYLFSPEQIGLWDYQECPIEN